MREDKRGGKADNFLSVNNGHAFEGSISADAVSTAPGRRN